jgi:hypothetical protein
MVNGWRCRANKFSPFPKDPTMTWKDITTGVVDLKFSSNGKKLAVSSMGSDIKIWDR